MDLAEIKGRLDNWFGRIVDYATEVEIKNQELDNDFYEYAIINFLNYAQSQHQLAEVLKWLDSEDGKKAFDYDLYAQKIYEHYQEISWDLGFDITPDTDTGEYTDEQILEAMKKFLKNNPVHLISKAKFA